MKNAISKLTDSLKQANATIKLFCFHPKNSILLYPRAGLGNRLGSINESILLSKQLDREIYVYWAKTATLNATFNDLLRIPPEFHLTKKSPYNLENRLKNNLKSARIPGILTKVFLWGVSYYFGKKWYLKNDYQAKLGKFTFFGDDNKQQDYPSPLRQYHNLIDRKVMPENYEWMIPTPELQKRINKIALLLSDVTIGIHLRMGPDNRSERWERKEAKMIEDRAQNRYTLETFIELMQAEVNKDSTVKFFVASDSRNAIENLKSVFGQSIIYQQNTEHTRGSTEGIKGAMVDLFLLSKMKLIIASPSSTFSKVASAMGKTDLVLADENIMKNTQNIQ